MKKIIILKYIASIITIALGTYFCFKFYDWHFMLVVLLLTTGQRMFEDSNK